MNRQEHYRQEYSRRKPGWRHSLYLFRDLVGRHSGPGGHILDVGCGHADFLQPVYAEAPGVIGCDPDRAALALNTTIALRAAGLADDLPFADARFDAVVMAWVLEHLADPPRVFSEVRRVLKPGGRLIFLTPNALNYTTWLIRSTPHQVRDRLARGLHGRQERDTYPVRYRANTAAGIDRALSAQGFRQLELILHGDPTYISLNRPLFNIACWLERGLDRPPLQRLRVHILGAYARRD